MSASPLPPSTDSPRPHAAGWLIGAFVLALAVQAIFLLMPEPKSAGATDPAAAEVTTPLDSTAFTLEEDQTALPTEAAAAAADSTGSAPDSVPPNAAPAPQRAPKEELEELLPPIRVDTAPVNSLPTLPDTAPGE